MTTPAAVGEEIVWRLRLAAPAGRVFEAWLDPSQHARFWCEDSEPVAGGFRLRFIDGTVTDCAVVRAERPTHLALNYFETEVRIDLQPLPHGTDLTLRTRPTGVAEWLATYAGWLNVLLPLKAWLDFGVDLRNHDPARTWRQGYADQ